MSEIYELPEIWCLKVDEENRSLINNWRINIIKFEDFDIPEKYKYVEQNGGGNYHIDNGYIEINTEQFKQLVLGLQPVIIDDLSYLIKLLKDLNIK
ncbi:MAG TPA: hypothetical protein PLH46_05705 [Caldisericia bacterium]|nr:hypothetical protein [Caldisericia bacterium]